MADATPTLILAGGRVLTVDPEFRTAEAVAVSGDRIVAVGTDAEVRALAGPATRVVELAGRTVLPGINDSHLHAAAYGMIRPPFMLDVGSPAVGSIADVAAAVRAAAAAARPGEWIVGMGWDLGYLAECLADPARTPHRHDLDAAAPENPVCLSHFSAHMVWANTAALRAGGIDRDTVPPPGGIIDKDEHGEPTGILREAAQDPVQRAIPEPDRARRRTLIKSAIADLHARGITSYTEPGLGPGGGGILLGGLSGENLAAYHELAAGGDLDARVSVLLLPEPAQPGTPAKALDPIPAAADPRRLRVIGIKIFADGVPPNHTAWMHEDYCDGGGNGGLVLDEEELRRLIAEAHAAGYQVGVHATGDRAIDAVVDAFLAANRAVPRPDARHYVIHGDFVGAGSLAKLAAHGYGLNMNPGIKWMTSDLMDEVVGPRRSAYQWPVRTAVEAGIAVCSGSDAPVTEPDWRRALAAMMLRESRASGRPSGPEQCVGLADAVRAYTINAARQDFAEDWKGSIEVGKVADLCVLDRDLTALDPHEIPDAEVDLTIFDGRVVFERQL